MKPIAVLTLCGSLAMLALAGCTADEPVAKQDPRPKASTAPAKKVNVGKNVSLEIKGDERRVVVDALVCLRQGMLEQFLTRKRTKEHEAILVADVDAREIHKALILAGAEPGSPVKFVPKYEPARGTVIKVFLEYEDAEKRPQRLPAQHWIRSIKTKKTLEHDFVFAGSVLIQDPFDQTKPPFYAANDGTVICVSNFESALLDLPIMSTKDNDDLFFEAHTESIPPLETPVRVILEPVLKKEQK
ncbi:MAG: YdjY domain-containing protein [Gemmataceae bacterium]|nr:YdjY domain-containing protein [Gemmataceae bacterium]